MCLDVFVHGFQDIACLWHPSFHIPNGACFVDPDNGATNDLDPKEGEERVIGLRHLFIGIDEKRIGQLMHLFELLMRARRPAIDAKDLNSAFFEGLPFVTNTTELHGTAGSHIAGIKNQNNRSSVFKLGQGNLGAMFVL